MDWLPNLSSTVVEYLVYTAITLVTLAGVSKCILPLQRSGRLFRRATRSLELMAPSEGTRPVWQDALFLGKPLQAQWKRFLMNAEQLDARSLSCDVEDYINEDSAFARYAHLHLSEIIPGLLTSLGILGTFIGLMRGIGSLDVTSADKTMGSITRMIGGMSFAYGTSIAGLACSLGFNIIIRAAHGSAVNALNDFHSAFRELVMQRPVDDNVHSLCRQEDQAAFLNRAVNDVGMRITSGIESAVERAFIPISQSISGFIIAETQGQIEGLGRIVNQFVAQMNGALNGQFVQLAKTLSSINQAQSVSFESISHTMTAADAIMEHIDRTNAVTQAVIERFESYVSELSRAQSGGAELAGQMSAMADAMHKSLQQQSESYGRLLSGQTDLQRQMEQYAAWSGRVLEAVEKQSDAAAGRSHEVANEMSLSSKKLADSYANFVENISTGLARTMGMFEENLHDMVAEMGRQLSALAKAQGKKGEGEGDAKGGAVIDLSAMSKMQQAMADMTAALNRAVTAVEQYAAGA